MLKVQKPLWSENSCLQCVFVRCVYVYSFVCVCVCVKCDWCVWCCSREAAVVLQCNYSLSAPAGGYSPVDSEPSGSWLQQQIDHSWHWPSQPHSTLGEEEEERWRERKKGREVEEWKLREGKMMSRKGTGRWRREDESGKAFDGFTDHLKDLKTLLFLSRNIWGGGWRECWFLFKSNRRWEYGSWELAGRI